MSFTENPVFIKEVKTKMRSKNPPQVQWVVGSAIGLFIVYCYYQAINWLLRSGGASAGEDGWVIGVTIQAVLIWMLAPALTANAISQEKEQQTWEMLVFTLLRPPEIILGKLTARLAPMAGLLLAFFPFMAICFLLSSRLGIADLVAVYLVFVVWILFLTVCGLFMSWAFKKTAAAIATAYLVVFVLVIGTALVNMTLYINQPWGESPVWWLNPVRVTSALTEMHTDSYAGGVIWFSSATFLAAATFLLWRMVSRFREFSTE